MYESLSKIYYTNPQLHTQLYRERFSSPSSVHLPIAIRQHNHNKEYPVFFSYTPELALSLEQVYSRFSDFLSILPKATPIVQHQYAQSSIIEEVHSTSDIEGINSTHRELREILDGGKHNRHFSSIIRKYELLSSGEYPSFATSEDVRSFYDEFVHVDAIANNPKNRLDGKLFRREGVDVLNPSGKIIHRGVEPEARIIEYMSEALRFLNSDEYPALVRIAVFHYLFVYIHPFYDGNGRTARFISSCYIAQHLQSLIGLRLSVTLKRQKTKYYALLKETDAELNCGDMTLFICGFLEFIAETVYEITHKLERKIAQLERMKQKLFVVLGDDDDVRNVAWNVLQSSVFYGSGTSMEDLIVVTGRSRNTIKSKLSKMPVRVITRARKHFYKIDWASLR